MFISSMCDFEIQFLGLRSSKAGSHMFPMAKLISLGDLIQVLQGNIMAEGCSCVCDLSAMMVM